MYECFMEIGFEAELNTEEDPELLELAAEICNENPATRAACIAELRQMVFDRGECVPFRMDDAFLLKFLRVKDFVVPRAHRQLVRYCTFKEQYKELYEGVDLWGLMKVRNVFEGNMSDHPDVGRVLILRFAAWDTSAFPIEDLVRGAIVLLEIGLRNPKLQVMGGSVIVDLEGITLKQMSMFTPTIAYQIVCLMGLAMPTRSRGYHVINYSWVMNTFFYIFKRFIPQHIWGTIHFHGSDVKSLQNSIRLDCLPPRYGGTCRSGAEIEHWLKKIKKYRNEQFDKEMKQLGYVIKE